MKESPRYDVFKIGDVYSLYRDKELILSTENIYEVAEMIDKLAHGEKDNV